MLGKEPKIEKDLPLEIALENIATEYMIPQLSRVDIPTRSPYIPSLSSHINFNIVPLPISKQHASPVQLQAIREDTEDLIKTLYKDHQQMYVDGSVDPDTGRAGSAFILKCTDSSPLIQSANRISDWVSSTQAEVAAIFMGIKEIPIHNYSKKIVIFCDSMAAILELQRTIPDPLNPLVYDTLKLIHQLCLSNNISITIHWIPSHIGIYFNELVDHLAKEGSKLAYITLVVPATVGQIKATIKRYTKNKTRSTSYC